MVLISRLKNISRIKKESLRCENIRGITFGLGSGGLAVKTAFFRVDYQFCQRYIKIGYLLEI